MEAAGYSEMLAPFYHTPGDSNVSFNDAVGSAADG
jgi:hypothetical protein